MPRPALLPLLILVAAAGAFAQAGHVVVIGIDGFGAQAIRDNPVPAIRALMASGSWTLRARGVMPTVSSPNWASMIMGAGPEQHGVLSNEWQPDRFEFSPVCRGMAATFPTIFGLMRQQHPASRISILHDWKDFARLVEPGAATFTQHVLGSPNTVNAAIEEWRAYQPQLLFVHLDDVDHAGHDNGWGSEAYRAAVAAIDHLVGKLVGAVKDTAEGRRTAIILTGDHGGMARKHGGNTMAELEIPWVASGAEIAVKGEMVSAVNTFDTAATIAALLRLKTPDCWLGRPVAEALRRR